MRQNQLFKTLIHYFNLEAEVDDFDKIHETIVKDIVFKGTNLWILMFAIVVASVGLNMNSTAVIIGAMLISPLMGPINGMGYSIATYDFTLLRKSLKNFSFAVITSLVASTTYFALSPISFAHSELLARINPTIYDVLIALFGGLAGIVAISSKQKGNVIPGVAIATALMPPLCTAGYGLATGQVHFFLGAIYLFTINTVFIALASVAVCQILKFPIKTIVDIPQQKRVNRLISAIIVIVLFPSIFFGYKLVQNERFSENANKYIASIGLMEGNYLLRSEINPGKRIITLVYGGTTMNKTQQNRIKEKSANFSIQDAKIDIQQGLTFDTYLEGRNTETDNLKAEINQLRESLKERDMKLDSLKNEENKGRQLLAELRSLYPQVNSCSYSETLSFSDSDGKPVHLAIVLINSSKKGFTRSEEKKLQQWLQFRLNQNQLKLIIQK